MSDFDESSTSSLAPKSPQSGLRDRIAIVQQSHIFCLIECLCGLQFERKPRKDWRIADDDWRAAVEWRWAQHVADAVIAELGLRVQVAGPDGIAHGQHRYISDWITNE